MKEDDEGFNNPGDAKLVRGNYPNLLYPARLFCEENFKNTVVCLSIGRSFSI